MEKYKTTLNFLNEYYRANIQSMFEQVGVPQTFIEIGSYEGCTSCYISDNYGHIVDNKMQIYCIDPHSTSEDLESDMNVVRENFLYNLSVCENKNINYMQMKSFDGLLELINKKVTAQLIYIDGDHKSSSVLEDLVLSWKLVSVGGVILCDDVQWINSKNGITDLSPSMAPRMAVENFIQCNWHKIHLLNLPYNGQTAFIKLSD